MKKNLRTQRMRQIRLSQKRHRHELRKKRKRGRPSLWYSDDGGHTWYVSPHIVSMFKTRKKKKSKVEKGKELNHYKKVVSERRKRRAKKFVEKQIAGA